MVTIKVRTSLPTRALAKLGQSWAKEWQRAMDRALTYARQPKKRRPIGVRTGTYLASLGRRVSQSGNLLRGVLYSTDKKAVVLEYGGTRPAHRIEARDHGGPSNVIAAGGIVFGPYADIPAVTQPPRPNLRPSMRQAVREFRAEVRKTLREAGIR